MGKVNLLLFTVHYRICSFVIFLFSLFYFWSLFPSFHIILLFGRSFSFLSIFLAVYFSFFLVSFFLFTYLHGLRLPHILACVFFGHCSVFFFVCAIFHSLLSHIYSL